MSGDEQLIVTLPAADATLEAECAVEAGRTQCFHHAVTLAATLANDDNPPLFLDTPFFAFGQVVRCHQHCIDDVSGFESGLVTDIDYRRSPVDHAHGFGGRDLQQHAGTQLQFNGDDRDSHEQRRPDQKRVSRYKLKKSVHSA